MLTDKELAAVPEELLEDLLRYSEYGWRERRIATLLARVAEATAILCVVYLTKSPLAVTSGSCLAIRKHF